MSGPVPLITHYSSLITPFDILRAMLHRFPQEAVLRDERRVMLRPFGHKDVDALYEFFHSLPADYRRFAWDQIDNRSLIDSWGHNVDYAKVFPLLAWSSNKIVADATLHRRKGGPLRLVGRIKWMIDPQFRGVGLGTMFVSGLIMTKLLAEMHLTRMWIRYMLAVVVAYAGFLALIRFWLFYLGICARRDRSRNALDLGDFGDAFCNLGSMPLNFSFSNVG